MAKIKIDASTTGTGTFTISAPNSNTDRTLTLPDTTASLVTTNGASFTGNVAIEKSANTLLTVTETGAGAVSIQGTGSGGRVYSNASNKLLLGANGQNSHIAIDTSGNVGIGTTSPNYPLDVYVSGTNANLGIQSHNSTPGSYNQASLRFSLSSTSSSTLNWDVNAEQTGLTFDYEGSEKVRIGTNGAIGIGGISPSTLLQIKNTNVEVGPVEGSGGATSIMLMSQGGTYTDDYYYAGLGWAKANSNGGTIGANISPVMTSAGATKALTFGVTSSGGTTCTEHMRIDNTGNVGIGSTTLLGKLDVELSGSNRRLLVTYDDSIITVKGSNASSNPESIRLVGDSIRFSNGTSGSGTERMRIDSNGRVTTPYQPAFNATDTSETTYTYGENSSATYSTDYKDVFPVGPNLAFTTNTGSHAALVSYSQGYYLKFTAPVAGWYMFGCNVNTKNSSASDYWALGLEVNNIGGSSSGTLDYYFGHQEGSNSILVNLGGSVQVYLNANDYVVWYSRSADLVTKHQMSNFWGRLVG